jgi:hypothetical protein
MDAVARLDRRGAGRAHCDPAALDAERADQLNRQYPLFVHVPAEGGLGQSAVCVATVHAFVQIITLIIRNGRHMWDAQLASVVHVAPNAAPPPPSVVASWLDESAVLES